MSSTNGRGEALFRSYFLTRLPSLNLQRFRKTQPRAKGEESAEVIMDMIGLEYET